MTNKTEDKTEVKTNTKAVSDFINKLTKKGKTYPKIKDALVTMDLAENVKEAEGFLKTEGIEKSAVTKRGITDSMYDYIGSEERSAEELKKWIEENGTANTLRWIKSHDKVRELVNTVRKATEATEGEAA